MMNILAPFYAIMRRRKAARALRAAERRRAAIMAHIADRKAHRREFRPMVGDLRHATNKSLAAFCGREWVR